MSLSVIFIILIIALSGCGNHPAAAPTATPLPPTPEASATATMPPATLALYDPAGSSSTETAKTLSDFAAANALGFETWTSLPVNFDGVKIVVVNGGLDNLAQVAAAAPKTQFLVISQSLTPSANISVISVNPVHLAFMAGYLAAMTAEDWRAGALLSDDANLGLADAFVNGGQYLCGRCPSTYGPILFYPQVYPVSGQSDAAAWTAQATELLTDTSANSVFIDRGGDISDVLDKFSNTLLYGSDPGSPNLSRYTAILGPDLNSAFQQALPDLLAGNGGKTFAAKVSLLVINNADIISPAKQALFNQVSQALEDNLITPLSVP
jgi:hypothetical protein